MRLIFANIAVKHIFFTVPLFPELKSGFHCNDRSRAE